MAWQFGLYDLQGNFLGAVRNLQDPGVSLVLNGLDTAKFTIRADNVLATEITERNCDVLLCVIDDGEVRFTGECTGAEKVAPNGYRHIWKRDTIITRAYCLPNDWPGSADVRQAEDGAALSSRGLYEEVIPSDVGDGELRQALADANITFRKQAQETITFDPSSGSDDRPATLSCNFGGAYFRLGKRLIGKSVTGFIRTNVDRSQIIKAILDEANAEADTGIRAATGGGAWPAVAAVNTGPHTYKPAAEGITELVDLEWPPYVARDGFDQPVTGQPPLTGQTPAVPAAGAWGGNQLGGTNYDFAIDPSSGTVFRDGNFSFGVTRIDYIQLSTTAVIAGLDFYFSTTADSTFLAQGLIVRYDQVAQDWIQFVALPSYIGGVTSVTYVSFDKVIGGGGANITTAPVLLGPNVWYSMRIIIDAAGNYQCWLIQKGQPLGSPLISGTDSDFATGGTLAAGGVGIYDSFPSSQACVRSYDNIYAIDPNQSVTNLDFQITPSVPTEDTLATSTLSSPGISGADPKIPVADASAFPKCGTIRIGTEDVTYTGTYSDPPNNRWWFTGCARGANNTSPATHSTGATVTGIGVKIATMNTYAPLGTLKPNAIFQHGGGKRAIPQFGTHYAVGDSVVSRITGEPEVSIRNRGIDYSADENGKETIIPQLLRE